MENLLCQKSEQINNKTCKMNALVSVMPHISTKLHDLFDAGLLNCQISSGFLTPIMTSAPNSLLLHKDAVGLKKNNK